MNDVTVFLLSTWIHIMEQNVIKFYNIQVFQLSNMVDWLMISKSGSVVNSLLFNFENE